MTSPRQKKKRLIIRNYLKAQEEANNVVPVIPNALKEIATQKVVEIQEVVVETKEEKPVQQETVVDKKKNRFAKAKEEKMADVVVEPKKEE